MRQHYLSLDVESLGLFGPPFAVGFCLVDESGAELESGIYGWDFKIFSNLLYWDYASNDSTRWEINHKDEYWVLENVIPALPPLWANCKGIIDFYQRFYKEVWDVCFFKYPNLIAVSDCPFPVEFNFILEMLHSVGHRDMTHSPLPLIDVASVLLAHGYDPIATYKRREDELPAHDPCKDARQSIRLMLSVLKGKKIE